MPISHKGSSRKSRRKKRHSESRFAKHATNRNIGLASNLHSQNEYLEKSLHDLPMEILDIILQKSYIFSILRARRVEPIRDLFYFPYQTMPSISAISASNRTKDKDIITKIASVDDCWSERITRLRSKKAIWRYLAGLHRKLYTGAAIVRANKRYLLNAIKPDDLFISCLLSANCITNTQMVLINRLLRYKDRNYMLLRAIYFRDDKVYSNFVKCLRSTNQHLVAGVIENGGVVAEVKVTSGKSVGRKMAERQLIRDLNYFRDKARSTEVGKNLNILKMWQMEILHSYQKKGIIIWLWCKTKEAIQKFKETAKGKSLFDILRKLLKYLISTGEGRFLMPRNISVDKDIFIKEIVTVICQKSVVINFNARLEGAESEYAAGITKLGKEIFALCRSYHSPESNSIRVFEDHNRFRLQRKIQIMKIKGPTDIGSSAEERCLYVADKEKECVWKITEWSNPTQVTKWLSGLGASYSLSFCTSGRLLIVKPREPWSSLEIYGSDGQLIRSVQLMIQKPRHAVETSTGNFIVVHERKDGTDKSWVQAVSEVSADGSMVLRQFVPKDSKQDLTEPIYVLLDADDQVFVADKVRSGKVVLFDSDLRWNRILCSKRDDSEQSNKMIAPWRLFYDVKKKQLMVASATNARDGGVYVYTLQQK